MPAAGPVAPLSEPHPPLPHGMVHVPVEGLGQGAEGPRKRVVVVGAGLAGLVAAFELDRQGHEMVVPEARHRVGGRIHTLPDFALGLYAEAGGPRAAGGVRAAGRKLGNENWPTRS